MSATSEHQNPGRDPDRQSTELPETRERLLTTAERLFAERGIKAVTQNQIRLEAGVRNRSAVQYHFGDREGVIRAIVAKHGPRFEQRRVARLAEITADPRYPEGSDLARVKANIEATIEFLDDPDGGRNYLFMLAELSTEPELVAVVRSELPSISTAVAPHRSENPTGREVAKLFVASSMILHSIISYARHLDTTGNQPTVQREDLVDVLMSFLRAELGPTREG